MGQTKSSSHPTKLREKGPENLSLKPRADIYEASDGITLYLDLPGLSKEALEIDVNKNVLSIRGGMNLHPPENLEPTYMDIHSGAYERQFTLGDELAAEGIQAELKQGELKLFIPRSEQHKPRKIEVNIAE